MIHAPAALLATAAAGNAESNETGIGLAVALVVVVAVAAGAPPLVLALTHNAAKRWLVPRVRGLAVANIVTQAGIIVTGGAVRLTGSGLGCSTWPQCEPGSFVPERFEANDLHPFIEFGNRLLTVVLLAVAVLLAIAIWNGRRELRWWGFVPYAGVVAQAIVGGITVLVDLHPLVVGPHLMISAALVWNAVWLWLRVRGSTPRSDGPSLAVPRWATLAALIAVVFLGVLTTGAGPHSGDAEATQRLALDPAEIAKAHAAAVWVFVAVVGWLAVAVWRQRSAEQERPARRAVAILIAVTLAQGAIGYVQYFTGLPELVVALHLAGIGALVGAHSGAFYLTRRS